MDNQIKYFNESAEWTTEIIIPGTPKAKQRPRFTRSGHTYTAAETRKEESRIKAFVRKKLLDQYEAEGKSQDPEGMFIVSLDFHTPFPASYPKWKKEWIKGNNAFNPSRPDLDNLEKLIMDSLNGEIWRDDSQVIRKISGKIFTNQREGFTRLFVIQISKYPQSLKQAEKWMREKEGLA